jgi:glycosyltransferase involved in cell wall biosynthesis
MRVLFICNKSPFPPREGGPLAMNANIQSLLKAGHQVKVLALNTNKYFVDENEIPDSYREQTGIEFVYTDLSIKPLQAFLNLFSNKSYHVERFITPEIHKKIEDVLQRDPYDIVQLELLYMTPYIETIKKFSNAKIVLRSHNIEHLIWERITQTTKNPVKKLYLAGLTRKLKKYELDNLNSYDGIITITKKDAAYFKEHGCTIPLDEVPFGVEVSEYQPGGQNVEYPSLFHLGSMNWMPNEEGIKWFIEQVWPLFCRKYPNVKFYLAGRMMPEWINNLHIPNIEVLGEVADAKEFINSKAVMIVPLFSGSGIRIKIIEGMALAKAIIATEIGAEGINYTNGKDILIANDPAEFMKAIDQCFENVAVCHQLGKNARVLIENQHSLEHVVNKLEGFYNKLLKGNNG